MEEICAKNAITNFWKGWLRMDELKPLEKPLKPCPFCGSKAIIESFSVRKGFEATVSCTECLANMPTITFDFEETAYLEAIKDWNRRANNGN